jgi:AraC family transcriptional regulator
MEEGEGVEALPARVVVKGGLAGWQVRRLSRLAEEELGALTVRRLADTVGLSAHHFSRAFRVTFGVSPRAWLIEARMSRAKARLSDPTTTVEQIAQELGYSSGSQLSRAFRARFGMAPLAYRRR